MGFAQSFDRTIAYNPRTVTFFFPLVRAAILLDACYLFGLYTSMMMYWTFYCHLDVFK